MIQLCVNNGACFGALADLGLNLDLLPQMSFKPASKNQKIQAQMSNYEPYYLDISLFHIQSAQPWSQIMEVLWCWQSQYFLLSVFQ